MYIFELRNPFTFVNPCGSGSTNASLRPGSADLLGGFCGSKQYCWKHCVHIAERDGTGVIFRRARSMAAHWRQTPKLGSGNCEFGVKPWVVRLKTWSKNSFWCFWVYESANVAVLAGDKSQIEI